MHKTYKKSQAELMLFIKNNFGLAAFKNIKI